MRLREPLLILFIFIASFFFHIWRIDYPPTPVFDEVHFATYSAQYTRHETHFDIHPPLGKLLYAAVLFFYPPSTYNEANFIAIDTRNGLDYRDLYKSYADFPYVALRVLASLFGALLPVLGYLLLKNLTQNPYAPFLAALFLLFENTLLMETRLILLNGMLLVFGLAALIFFFGRKQNIYLAGILLGLALSIKLSAIVFAITICLGFMFSVPNIPFKRYGRLVATTIGIALFVLMLSVLSHFIFTSPTDQMQILQHYGAAGLLSLPPPFNSFSSFFQHTYQLINVSILQFYGMASSYIGGVSSHEAMSSWYTWPFMSGGFTYFSRGIDSSIFFTPARVLFEAHSGIMSLTGNIVLWLSGIFSVLFSVYIYLRKKWRAQAPDGMLILLLGWIAGVLPFGIVVSRSSFLYHYFPSLVFSLLLAAFWLGLLLEKVSLKTGRWILGGTFAFVIAGFLLSLPYTYGL